MARHRFAPSLGQRYVRTRPSLPQDVCFISEVIAPNTLAETELFVLSVELGPERLVYTRPELASHIQSGYLRPPGENILPEHRGLSLAELLTNSTVEQRRRLKMRVAYVVAQERAEVGLSWKSPDFRELVKATFQRRLASNLAECGAQGEDVHPIEVEPPSPHSVYRWLRQYRGAAGDIRALAAEVLVVHKRKPRRESEHRLLDAFMAHRRSAIGKTTNAQLTRDFNEYIRHLDPSHIDREIERLYAEAATVAKNNAAVRKKKGVKRTSKKRLMQSSSGNNNYADFED